MSKPKRKTLGERVAEKWLPEESKYRIELAHLVDREAKKMQVEERVEIPDWLTKYAIHREARASVALDKHPDGQTHCELPEPKKRRKRK